ncbi:MAG: 30S ribosomal protein S6e [Candidatus Thermoplasmatota archaeon]|nr:30S ribosomal protein S6e [Candidatus Thermoplasmatota archaeon]
MVEFKAVIADVKNGKTYQTVVSGQHANRLMGMKISDEFDGLFVSLPGYKIMITGGADKDGFPMRSDLPGQQRKKIVLSGGTGFKPVNPGQRKRKYVRGNTISADIVQINLKVTSYGPRSIEEQLKQGETE